MDILIKGTIKGHNFWAVSYWSIGIYSAFVEIELGQYPVLQIALCLHPIDSFFCCHQGQGVMIEKPVIFKLGPIAVNIRVVVSTVG